MTDAMLTPDQQLALKSAAARLAEQFDGVFGPETIERFLTSSYDQFASRATATNFLPVMAERFAKQRLKALARVEGKADDGLPTVLFLCVHNAGRSQMALGWFNHLAGDRAVAWSGGSEPGNEVNPAAIAAMKEIGIDIAREFPKPWTDEIVQAADVVVTMGCGDACPLFPGKRYEDWELEDPAGLGVEAVRPIRDEIERRVRELLGELGVPTRLDLLVAVAYAAHGDDARRVTRVVLDLGPQPLHVHVEGLGVAVVVRAPHPVDEHVAREHPPGVGEQQLEQLELLERQRDALAAHRHLVTRGVETHVADLQHLVGLRDTRVVAPTAAQRGPHPRHQLTEAERLGDVVVGAHLEARRPRRSPHCAR